MKKFFNSNKSKLAFALIFFVTLFLILAFVVYRVFNNQLFEISSFSTLQNSSDVRLVLEGKLVIGETSLAEIENFMDDEGVQSCSSVNAKLVCFTAAPKEFVRTDNIFRDLLNYILIIYNYRIEFEFRDTTLIGYNISKSSTGF